MSQALDTIPIRVQPLPGEALDSWFDAYAHRLQVQVVDILELAGLRSQARLPGGGVFGRKPWTPEVFPEEFAALSAVTGVAGEGLRAMTLAHYSGALISFDPNTGAVDRKKNPWWYRLQASRYCPRCLGENGGRWLLSWRLPWSYACLAHECLLRDTCPACSRHPGLTWHRRGRTPPGFCHSVRPGPGVSATRRAARCLYPLAAAPSMGLSGTSGLLTTQRDLDELLGGILHVQRYDPSLLPPLLGRLEDLHASARTVLSALHLTKELPPFVQNLLAELGTTPTGLLPGDHSGGGMIAADAPVIALALTTARHLLRDGSSQPDPDLTRWLLETIANQAGNSAPNAIFHRHRWARATPQLQGALLRSLAPCLRSHDRLRYRTEAATPSRPDPGAGRTRAARTPSLFWRGLALRFTPANVLSATPLSYRATLSTMLAVVGAGDLDYDKAQELLFFPNAAKGIIPRPGHATSRLREAGALDTVLAAITEVAHRLDEHGSPIDYERRRRTFVDATPDLRAHQEFRDQVGLRRAGATDLAILRWALIETLTGLHPLYLPAAIRLAARQRRSYEHWRFQMMTQPFTRHLEEQAVNLLEAAGIHEPVQWEPPMSWTDGLELPGPGPNSIPVRELWHLAAGKAEASKIAAAFNTTTEHVRVAMQLRPRPFPAHELPHGGTGPSGKIPRQNLPSAQQIKACQTAGMTLEQIAVAAGHSRSLMGRILVAAGVQANSPGRQPTHRIDPDWLRLEYETKRKSMNVISRESGISPETLRSHARKLGIAIRGRGHVSHPLGAHGHPEDFPPSIWNAFSVRNPETRVRRFLDALGHRSVRSAAKHLGTDANTLGKQIARVENAAGTPLLQRTPSGQRRLRLTPAGELFAERARAALALLSAS